MVILNEYGDKLDQTKSARGSNVSNQRIDDLDQACLDAVTEHVKSNDHCHVVDLGCGSASQSFRLAELGAQVTAIDLSIDIEYKHHNGIYIEKDFRDITAHDFKSSIDVLYSQRSLHYLRYQEMMNLLRMLYNLMSPSAMIFMSLAGYDTEYGLTYPDRNKKLEDRFTMVSPDMQKKHGIFHPLATYKKSEVFNILTDLGFKNIEVTQSDFGNIKAIATKPS